MPNDCNETPNPYGDECVLANRLSLRQAGNDRACLILG